MPHDELLDRIRTWYNGYRFEEGCSTVYNPVSVMKCFQEAKFKNYWFETGTPTFLVKLLKEQPINLPALLEHPLPETAFSTYDIQNLHPLPLLVQTGYLTIVGSEMFGDERCYALGYPNREISHSFSMWLAEGLSELPQVEVNAALRLLVRALQGGDLDEVHRQLRIFFENIPYDIQLNNEKYYQSIFFVIFKLLGFVVDVEVRTANGRIDAVITTDDHVFIVEFKLNDTATTAMTQIHEKKYYEKYQNAGKKIILIGAAFDKATRNLDDWLTETL